jgi:acyl-CoA reductase-like NAD-dependent aldehyde dehydrogenase
METLTATPTAVSIEDEERREIESMVARARSAQATIQDYDQEQADTLVTAVGWHVYKSREVLAKLAVEEGSFGNVADKITKIAAPRNGDVIRHGFNQDLRHRRGRSSTWLA